VFSPAQGWDLVTAGVIFRQQLKQLVEMLFASPFAASSGLLGSMVLDEVSSGQSSRCHLPPRVGSPWEQFPYWPKLVVVAATLGAVSSWLQAGSRRVLLVGPTAVRDLLSYEPAFVRELLLVLEGRCQLLLIPSFEAWGPDTGAGGVLLQPQGMDGYYWTLWSWLSWSLTHLHPLTLSPAADSLPPVVSLLLTHWGSELMAAIDYARHTQWRHLMVSHMEDIKSAEMDLPEIGLFTTSAQRFFYHPLQFGQFQWLQQPFAIRSKLERTGQLADLLNAVSNLTRAYPHLQPFWAEGVAGFKAPPILTQHNHVLQHQHQPEVLFATRVVLGLLEAAAQAAQLGGRLGSLYVLLGDKDILQCIASVPLGILSSALQWYREQYGVEFRVPQADLSSPGFIALDAWLLTASQQQQQNRSQVEHLQALARSAMGPHHLSPQQEAVVLQGIGDRGGCVARGSPIPTRPPRLGTH
jgi:hypothetical protein